MDRKYVVLRDATPVRRSRPIDRPVPRSRAGAAAQPPLVENLAVDTEEMTPAQAADVARDPSVLQVAPAMPTRMIEPFAVAEAEAAGDAWGIGAVGADRTNLTGAGVKMAVLDTGVDKTHPAFAGVSVTEKDFSGDGNGDRHGHGTHCAGTILGRDVQAKRIGIARGVTQLLAGKVLGDDGSGSSEMIFEAIEWASQKGAGVVSMSLGFDFPGLVRFLVDRGMEVEPATSIALVAYRENLRMFDALMDVLAARGAFGVHTVVVAAAGNESARQPGGGFEISAGLPAAATGVLSVAAAGRDGAGFRIADFSNTDATITGPGVDILSAAPGGGLRSMSGTSMACPHVAGVAALHWERVRNGAVAPNAQNVVAQLLATAKTDGFVAGTEIADRGVGMVFAA